MSSEEEIKLCDIIGNFGKYQIALLLTVFSATAIAGMSTITLVLLAPEVSIYWDWEASSPNRTIFRSVDCKMKDIYDHNSSSNVSGPSSKLIYESQYSKRTLTQELNLVCERSWMISLGNTIFALGIVLGSVILGRMSEIYGRKPCTLCVTFISLVSSLCLLFTKGYVMLSFILFVFGASSINICTYVFIEVLEVLPSKFSQHAGIMTKAGFLFGQTLFVGVAWVIEDWFYIQIFQTVFNGAFFFVLLYSLESPVWLAVRKRYEEARENIYKIVEKNSLKREALEEKINTYLEQIKVRCEVQSTAEKGKYSDLFKNRVIILYTLAMCVIWISVYFVYKSLMLNVETFGSGLYVDLTVSNAMSLGSILLALAILQKMSIRIQLLICFVCAGIVCAIFPLVYDSALARSALAILGRCLMSPPVCFHFVYISALYPTSLRGVATGFIATIGSLASSATPFTKELGEETALYVPFICFAVLSFICAGLYKVMPETKGKELVHTVDELLERRRKTTTTPISTISSKL